MVPMPDPADAALRAARSGAGPPGSVEVERYGMKRSLAWELASRRIRETERAKAKRRLLESHKATYAKDVVLDVELHPGRRVRAARLPCYIARFTHGELQGVDNKISDAVHHAFVCGYTGNVAVHDEIVCQNKVSALTVLACSVPGLAAAYAFGPEHYGTIAAQTVGASAVLSTVSGIVARQFPRVARRAGRGGEGRGRGAPSRRLCVTAPRLRVGRATAPVSRRRGWTSPCSSGGTTSSGGGGRRRTRVTGTSTSGRSGRLRFGSGRKFAGESERSGGAPRRSCARGWRRLSVATRRRRSDGGRGGGPGARGRGAAREGSSSRGRDVKGYYRLLGLHKKTHRATAEEIKTAYRREAMEWHPDKHQGTDAKKGRRGRSRQLQKAYQVLGNQQERDVYDAQ